jgi:hypothetical protein
MLFPIVELRHQVIYIHKENLLLGTMKTDDNSGHSSMNYHRHYNHHGTQVLFPHSHYYFISKKLYIKRLQIITTSNI